MAAAAHDGWNPEWDTPAEEREKQPESWEAFFADSVKRADKAMRDAGVDPQNALTRLDGLRAARGAVSRSGAALHGGLPSDGKLSCWGCDTSCSQRFECAACLEIYRDRATKAADDWWERAFFCRESCFQAHWAEHAKRHGPSSFGPCRQDSRTHNFAAAQGCAALWDSERLKRVQFEHLSQPDFA